MYNLVCNWKLLYQVIHQDTHTPQTGFVELLSIKRTQQFVCLVCSRATIYSNLVNFIIIFTKFTSENTSKLKTSM